jgi:hypothetical protein
MYNGTIETNRGFMKRGRKRGRPRKSKAIESKAIDVFPKRKRGRPRKHPLPLDNVPKRKRGRPRKNYPSYGFNNPEQPIVPTIIGKNLGHCPKCHHSISTLDIIKGKKFRYICYNCGKESSTTKLLKIVPKNKNDEYKPKNKKEYLEGCLATNNDSIPMHPPEIISKKELGEISSRPEE